MKNIWLFLVMAAILGFSSCERKSDNKSNQTTTENQSAKKDIDILVDSVNTAWKMMIDSDEMKFKDIKRLLDEISYTKDYDVAMHAELVKELDAVKAQRFDEKLDLMAVDKYDSLTDAYIQKVYILKSKSKEIVQHPLAEQLVNDINQANSAEITVALRMYYDRWAKIYNDYLKKNKKKLEKEGEPYASLTERPRFLSDKK